MTESSVTSLAPNLDLAQAETLALTQFGINGSASSLPSERDQNFMLDTTDGGFVLKLTNPAEDQAVIDLQCEALQFLERGPHQLPIPQVCPTLSGETACETTLADGRQSLAWMVRRLPGRVLEDDPKATTNSRIGKIAAQMCQGLAGFFHPSGRRELIWDLNQAQRLVPLANTLEGHIGRQVSNVLNSHALALSKLQQLPAQFIHNDLNPANLLCRDGQISGVVDFGDMVHTARVNELAIACAYRLYEAPDTVKTACELALAWHRVTPLTSAELDLLPLLIATRMATTVAVSHWRAAKHPDNRDYILCHTERAERALTGLEKSTAREELTDALARTCGLVTSPARSLESLINSRQQTMGRGLRLLYDTPLHLVSGSGTVLRTADGGTFLDCYNNVAHVGHAHPAVVTAMARQSAKLNTNTRYLTDAVVNYAERLAQRFPDPLNVVRFTCTGSEATDLALRIAGSGGLGKGTLVSQHAYHGNTAVGMGVSPEETGLNGLASWAEAIVLPDPMRYPHWEEVFQARVDALAQRGHPVGALLFDTLFTSDGIFVPPSAAVDSLITQVRQAGGVWIADEVQAGFGRTGEYFWGFERFDSVPDMVTLGKPMGNGYPMAAIVMTEAMAAKMDALYYFNTFAGNPVAAAAGSAVLDVIDDQQLQARATSVGRYLAAGIQERINEHSNLGELRGLGLHRGIEIVAGESRAPDAQAAAQLLNRLKQLGVLLGRTGRHGNVLKLRPPLIFCNQDANVFLDALDQALERS